MTPEVTFYSLHVPISHCNCKLFCKWLKMQSKMKACINGRKWWCYYKFDVAVLRCPHLFVCLAALWLYQFSVDSSRVFAVIGKKIFCGIKKTDEINWRTYQKSFDLCDWQIVSSVQLINSALTSYITEYRFWELFWSKCYALFRCY